MGAPTRANIIPAMMHVMKSPYLLAAAAIIALGTLILFVTRPTDVGKPTSVLPMPAQEIITEVDREAPPKAESSPYQTLYTSNIAGSSDAYQFETQIPTGWKAEAVAATQAINIYDPNAPGETPLEQSQIFVRHFSANTFLTLQTVIIHERSELSIVNRPAVRYDIEKKAGVTNFPDQPEWRSRRHIVTDVRVNDANPSVFLVIAKQPDLSNEIYQHVLTMLVLTQTKQPVVAEPIADFLGRITKKPFGILITPQTSPVQPERFSGYHTAVDVEYTDIAEDVPIYAIADGTVISVRTASGYGGLLIIEHQISGEQVYALYGHININSVSHSIGSLVQTGDTLGILGIGGSVETDGARKHLHFAIRKAPLFVAGYVSSAADLSGWYDPIAFLTDLDT